MPLYQSLYERLSSQHEAIGVIISKAGDDRLDFRYGPEKWSVRDIIAHLMRYQEIFFDRVKTILRENSPNIDQYTHSHDGEFEKMRANDISEMLNNISSKRREIFNLITSLNEEDLIRTGVHPRYGRMDIAAWTDFFLLHEAHHLLAIFRMVHDTANKL